MPAAAELAARLKLPKRGISLDLTASNTGVDLVIGARGEPDLDLRQWMSGFAAEHDLARISWGERDSETIIVRRNPVVSFGDIEVEIPPGGFLQASAAAEEVLAGMVGEQLEGGTQVADLYAGVGTFALSLASSGVRVNALDGDEAAMASLQGAINRRAGRLSATTEVRDLEQRPLSVKELGAYHGVVLDPPRTGAARQCEVLAGASVSRIAYVSCHPGSFARDTRTLVDGGYSLTSVTPVNQFPFSPHVELVGMFER